MEDQIIIRLSTFGGQRQRVAVRAMAVNQRLFADDG